MTISDYGGDGHDGECKTATNFQANSFHITFFLSPCLSFFFLLLVVGESCPAYEVMISIISANKNGKRVYKVEHSGQGTVEEHLLEVDPNTDIIYVKGKGGVGGNGYAFDFMISLSLFISFDL